MLLGTCSGGATVAHGVAGSHGADREGLQDPAVLLPGMCSRETKQKSKQNLVRERTRQDYV